jgi:hypothetical protein
MRRFRQILVPLLAVVLACGPSRLSRREAETDIRKDYPVQVNLLVPETASAVKGSPEHAKLVILQEMLTRPGWFNVARSPQGDRETFIFKPAPSAPPAIRPAPRGFQLPAAEAEFVRATAMGPDRDGTRVTYQIRLVRPTPFFGVFQAMHPGVKIGDTKDRHATYRRQGRDWVLQGTDEAFRKKD